MLNYKTDKGCSNVAVAIIMRIEMALEFFQKFSTILLPSAPLTKFRSEKLKNDKDKTQQNEI